MPFTNLLLTLRSRGLKVSMQEWLIFLEALTAGLVKERVADLYFVGRAILVKHEGELDIYDEVFLHLFEGAELSAAEITDELLNWLQDPKLPKPLTEEELRKLEAMRMDLEELNRMFEERMKEQKERHDGGSRWVGTGGTSPFGAGGQHPSGIRVGPVGGGQSAMQVAAKRQFKNYRHDMTLDLRGTQVALKKLRKLKRVGAEDELDMDETISATCRNGGDIEMIFRAPRKNETRLMLLMDSGGSMTPFARLVSNLFSAAHGLNHFKSFEHFYFHNCVYEVVFEDIRMGKTRRTAELLRETEAHTNVIFVGDAYMNPMELLQPYGSIDYAHRNEEPGLLWLRRFRNRFPNTVWLNPLRERLWNAASVSMVKSTFPMFPLTVAGVEDAVSHLRLGVGK